MKKIALAILLSSTFYNGFSQSYKEQLKNINEFLKTFDNGYYGYLEIKDGYLYDRFKDGNNYCRAKIIDLNKAYEKESSRKVELPCKGTDNCLYSTFTNQNYNSFSFSQATDFNSTELISLLDNLVSAYKGTNAKSKDGDRDIDYASEKRKQESLKSNTDNNGNNTTSTKNNYTGNYQSVLKKLNDYLKTFDNGYYGYFEVKDGYIYDRFKAGKYNKFKMEDIEGAVIQEQYSRVIFKCKGENKCISTDWKANGTEDYTQFTQSSSYNYQELADLLNNFRDAYLGKKQPSTNNTTISANESREQKSKQRQQTTSKTNDDDLDEDWDALESSAVALNKSVKEAAATSGTNKNYQVPLQKLNEYLKTFNAETYKDVEVKDGKVYFGFFVYGANYKSSIDISELKNNTIITIGKSVGSSVVDEVKISCKGGSKCFYSTYSNGGADHFRFFSHSVKDFTKMEQLLKDFIKALN